MIDYFKLSDFTVDIFNFPMINKEVKKKEQYFLSEKELRKHIEFNNEYEYNNKDKVYCFVKGRKYWLSGRFYR